MDRDLSVAFAVARTLTEGKSAEELARLQIILQTVASLVGSELACKKLTGAAEHKKEERK